MAGFKKGSVIETSDKVEQLTNDVKSSINTLDETAQKRAENIVQRSVSNQVVQNVKLETKIKAKELKLKFEQLGFPRLRDVLKRGFGRYARLMESNIISTLAFSIMILCLIAVHTVGVGNVFVSLKTNPFVAYPTALVLAGLFEISMVVFTLDYKHREAKLAMWAGIAVMGAMAVMELYYKTPEDSTLLESIRNLEFMNIARIISGIALIPVAKGLVISSRDSRLGKKKTGYETMSEAKQEEIQKKLAHIKDTYEKTNMKSSYIKQDFNGFSNTYKIYQHSLKSLCIKMEIYDKKIWKNMPKESRGSVKKIDAYLADEMVKLIDTYQAEHDRPPKVNDLYLLFAPRGVDKKTVAAIYKEFRPEFLEEAHPKKSRNRSGKTADAAA